MSVRLTETERKVAELYMAGVKPREIANRLGISINTVYKALSKARRAMPAVDGRGGQSSEKSMHNMSVYVYTLSITSYVYQNWPVVAAPPQARLLNGEDAIIKKLDEILAILKSRRTLQDRPSENLREPPTEKNGGNANLPEAIKKNVWISLLRNKTT